MPTKVDIVPFSEAANRMMGGGRYIADYFDPFLSSLHTPAAKDPWIATSKSYRAMADQPIFSRQVAQRYPAASSEIWSGCQNLPGRSQYCNPRPGEDRV